MPKTIISILVLVSLSGVPVHAGEKDCSSFTPDPLLIKPDRKTVIEEENQKFASLTAIDPQGVVLINLFNGYFPLPSRYVLMAGIAHHGQPVRYVSPPTLYGNKKILLTSLGGLVGNVRIGKYRDYVDEMKQADSIGPPSKQQVIFECVTGNLKVELKKHPEFPDVLRIMIHTEKEYIDLVDENPYLWKHLLDIYLTTIKKET